MQWYSHLYVGKKAKRHRYAIIQGIREEKLQPEVYVITSPQNGENLCDIYPSAMLLFPSEKKKERMILGIAVTYWRPWRWRAGWWMICIRKQERYQRRPLPALQELTYGSNRTGNLKNNRDFAPDHSGPDPVCAIQRAACAGPVSGGGQHL